MKHLLTAVLALALLTGCVQGKRLVVSETQTADGIWAAGGWLIRSYPGLTMRTGYNAMVKIAKEYDWDIDDRHYGDYYSELECEDQDDTDINIAIWLPSDGSTPEVGINIERGDAKVLSAEFLDKFEKLAGVKRAN